jgi:hypothetical protein
MAGIGAAASVAILFIAGMLVFWPAGIKGNGQESRERAIEVAIAGGRGICGLHVVDEVLGVRLASLEESYTVTGASRPAEGQRSFWPNPVWVVSMPDGTSHEFKSSYLWAVIDAADFRMYRCGVPRGGPLDLSTGG